MDRKGANHYHKCEECSTKSDKQSKLESHIEKQRFRRDTGVFSTRLKFVKHKKEDHVFKCHECEKLLEGKSQPAEHTEINHELKCKSCTKTSDFPNKLEEYTKKEHYFECKECDDACETTEDRKSHVVDGHFECVQCGKSFNNQAYLVRHTNHAHLHMNKCSCHICGEISSISIPLQCHVQSKHEGLKGFECTQCENKCGDSKLQDNS